MYLQLLRKAHPAVFDDAYAYRHGQARLLRDGRDVTLVSTGLMTHKAREAAALLAREGVEARHLHLPCVKPLDADAILTAARETGGIVTCENGFVAGGLGGAIAELLAERHPTPVRRIGVQDRFGEVATADYLLEKHGMTPRHIAAAALELFRKKAVLAA